jgi:hypothetical protein
MAIPEKELELDVDTGKMTLKDAILFDPDEFSLAKFRRFLIKFGSWSEVEVDEITLNELERVSELVKGAMENISVPLASDSSSDNGQRADQPTLPTGSSS